MLCCLLALLAMAGAAFARWRRLIGGLAAALLLGGASAALALSLAHDGNHSDSAPAIVPLYCGERPNS